VVPNILSFEKRTVKERGVYGVISIMSMSSESSKINKGVNGTLSKCKFWTLIFKDVSKGIISNNLPNLKI
jgi:hypothetical protein